MKLPDKKLVAYSNLDVLKKALVEKGILATVLGALFAGFIFFLGFVVQEADPDYKVYIWGVGLTFSTFQIMTAAIAFVAPQIFVLQSYLFDRGKRVRCTECGSDRCIDEIEMEKSTKRCGTCYHELD